jgi:predicted DNA-binding protein YlxM (UPF0122 family)
MSTVNRPFQSGKCQICNSKENLAAQQLCPECEAYASQDYVGQVELPLTINPDWLPVAQVDEPTFPDLSEYENDHEKFENILRSVRLTSKQRAIMKRRFLQNESLGEISFKLGISRTSVFKHIEYSVKKLKKQLTNSHIVKGQCASAALNPPENSSLNKARKTKIKRDIDPHLYYANCAKCKSIDLYGKENKGICQKCGWTFAVYSVEEVQNSHPYPNNPILDGRKY